MLDKPTYIQTKKDIKCMCRKNLKTLCDDMQLNELEKSLLLDFYDDKTSVDVCMRHNINKNTYTNHLKTIMTKIDDYKNTL